MRTVIFSIFISLSFLSFSQVQHSELEERERALNQLLSALRAETKDSILERINGQFKIELEKTLALEGAFDYPFSLLKTMGKIHSKDNLVRVISWNVQKEDFSHDYYAYILKKNERTKRVAVTELQRNKQNLYTIREATLSPDNWYGALYYEIIDVRRNNRTFYTLLGYDANDRQSTFKLIDVLYFRGNTPLLGFPLFITEIGKTNRIIFEYSANATMSLRYDENREKVIFDHLSPESPTLKDFRAFYVPDLSYDAYHWSGTQWDLEEDIIAINEPNAKEIELKAFDPKSGEMINVPIKNKWINPENANTPIESGTHRAVLPQDDVKNTNKKKNKPKKERVKEKKKGKYSGVSSYKLEKKKRRNR